MAAVAEGTDLLFVGKFVSVKLKGNYSLGGLVYTIDPSLGHIVLLRFVEKKLVAEVCMSQSVLAVEEISDCEEMDKLLLLKGGDENFAPFEELLGGHDRSSGSDPQDSEDPKDVLERLEKILSKLEQARVPFCIKKGEELIQRENIKQQSLQKIEVEVMDGNLILMFPFVLHSIRSTNSMLISRFRRIIFEE